jgi:hypothetical protein
MAEHHDPTELREEQVEETAQPVLKAGPST